MINKQEHVMLTKEKIVEMLRTDARAVARALVVLTARQTADERAAEHTKYNNGLGFRPCHARMGTNMAQFFTARGYLTEKQIAYWRVQDKSGSMRIGIYAGQLLEAAAEKAAVKALTSEVAPPPAPAIRANADYGNDMEEAMVVEEQLDAACADPSSDDRVIKQLSINLANIYARWAGKESV